MLPAPNRQRQQGVVPSSSAGTVDMGANEQAGVVNPLAGAGAMQFDEGGVVPDALDQTSETGGQPDQVSDRINRALTLVNQALMYGYQKFGLNGGQQAQQAPEQALPTPQDGANDSENDNDEDDGVIPEQSFAEGGEVEDPADSSLIPEQEAMPEGVDTSGVAPLSEPTDWESRRKKTAEGMRQRVDQLAANPAFHTTEGEAAGYQAIGQAASGGASRIMQMLQGAFAADPAEVQRAEDMAKHEHPDNPGAQKLAAVEIGSGGDVEKALTFLQANRKPFELARGFAANALDDNNLESAAKAATKAYHNVLDGTDVDFHPIRGGIAVSIKPIDGPAQLATLTIPQFRDWLTKQSGQYDNIYHKGAYGSIQEAAQTAAAQQGPQPPGRRAGAAPPAGTLRNFSGQGQVAGARPQQPADPLQGSGIQGSDKYVAPRATAEDWPAYDPNRDSSLRTNQPRRSNVSVIAGGQETNHSVPSGTGVKMAHNPDDPYNSVWKVGSSAEKYSNKDQPHAIAWGSASNGQGGSSTTPHPYQIGENTRIGDKRIGGEDRRLTAKEAAEHARYPYEARAAAMAAHPGDYTAQMEQMRADATGKNATQVRVAEIKAETLAARHLETIHSKQEIETMKQNGMWDRLVASEAQKFARTIGNVDPSAIKTPEKMAERMKAQPTMPAQQPSAVAAPQQAPAPRAQPTGRGSTVMSTQGTQLPTRAIQMLKEGQPTTFNNGQIWTLRAGRPVQVQ